MKDTVTVTAPNPRRRAGHRFGPHPVEIDRTTLTDAQWEALKTDPFLRITVETVDAAEMAPTAETEAAVVKPAKPKKS